VEARIRFTFDYVDPGSFLLYALLLRWRDEGRAVPEVEWAPLELRPPPGPLLDPGDVAWGAMMEAMAEEARASGIPFRIPGAAPRTRKAHELGLHALEKGAHGRIHDALFRAHFQEGRDLGRVDVLVELAVDGGLDGAEVRTVLGVDRFLPRLQELRSQALAAGVRGVPTLEWGGTRLEGFTGPEDLRAFLEGGPTPPPGGGAPSHDLSDGRE
jgi:predicted DsbA family dithiol-disulfide isomerase